MSFPEVSECPGDIYVFLYKYEYEMDFTVTDRRNILPVRPSGNYINHLL
jgi:hypothetical protein